MVKSVVIRFKERTETYTLCDLHLEQNLRVLLEAGYTRVSVADGQEGTECQFCKVNQGPVSAGKQE